LSTNQCHIRTIKVFLYELCLRIAHLSEHDYPLEVHLMYLEAWANCRR